MIRLEHKHIDSLLAQPETGMGYQLVEVELAEGGRAQGVAYNAELVVMADEPRTRLRTTAFESLVTLAERSEDTIKSIRVIQPEKRVAVQEKLKEPSSGSGEARNGPIEDTKTNEEFKRFSAYRNDRRVLPNRSLLPGTYATTAADAKHVKTGSEAVRRYALPNPAPAVWVFTSRPHASTPIQYGIVAPANGQPGGGVEVIFPIGTQPATTTGPVQIPP